MAHSISTHLEPTYVHFVVTGDNTAEDVARYLEKIRRLSMEHNRAYVLIEEHLVGPSIGPLAVFGIASRGAEAAQSAIRAIAYVDTNPQHDRTGMEFAENVAVNRGLHVKLFAKVAEAKRWLAELTGSAAPKK